MGLTASVHVLETPLTNGPADTEAAVAAFLAAGCRVIVSLGGDGTNRAIARALGDAGAAGAAVDLIPLSTGTNNVFPVLAEPTAAGMAAGLIAAGHLPDGDLRRSAKVIHLSGTDAHGRAVRDLALVDAVLLRDDHVGNLLPFAAQKLARIVLTRAEPDAVGMSPIGGILDLVEAEDEEGLLVEMGPGVEFLAPLSPGAFQSVSVRSASRLPLDTPVPLAGPGVVALDGDRDYKIAARTALTACIRRDGPKVVDIPAAMRRAAARGIMAPAPSG